MGPRAMAMVPTDRMDLLAGISLPDAELLDHSYDLHVALLEHNRVAAADAAGIISSPTIWSSGAIQTARAIAATNAADRLKFVLAQAA